MAQHHLAPLLDLVTMDHLLGLVFMDQHHLASHLVLMIMDHFPALLLAPLVIWDHHHLPCLLVCHLAPLLDLGMMGHHQLASLLDLVTMRMDPCTTLDLEQTKQEQVDLHLTLDPTLAPLPTLDLT